MTQRQRGEAMQHLTGKGEKMQTRPGRREAIVVARQAPEEGGPGEVELDFASSPPT